MMEDKTRNAMMLAIMLRQHPDFYSWPTERQEKAVTDLWNEALDVGLKGILDTIQMLDDMAKEYIPDDATLKRRE